jgi:hypothetical protein
MTKRCEGMLRIPASAVASVGLFTTTLFLFGPFTIYLTNAIEFSITPFDLALVGLGLAAMASLILFLVLFLLKAAGAPALEKGAAIVFAAGFLLWTQGNFLLWRYGPLDGRDIAWKAMRRFGYLDGAVWLVILVAALVFSSAVLKIAARAALLIMLVQLIYGAYLFSGQQETPSFKRYSVDTAGQFVFSKRSQRHPSRPRHLPDGCVQRMRPEFYGNRQAVRGVHPFPEFARGVLVFGALRRPDADGTVLRQFATLRALEERGLRVRLHSAHP